MKPFCIVLATCLLLAPLAREARADGDRATRQEEQDYAGREARAPELAGFQGGCMSSEMMWVLMPLLIAVAPVALLVWGCTALCEAVFPTHSEKKLPPPEPAPAKR